MPCSHRSGTSNQFNIYTNLHTTGVNPNFEPNDTNANLDRNDTNTNLHWNDVHTNFHSSAVRDNRPDQPAVRHAQRSNAINQE